MVIRTEWDDEHKVYVSAGVEPWESWLLMVVYWAVGYAAAISTNDIWDRLFRSVPPIDDGYYWASFGACLLATVLAQAKYYWNTTDGGRAFRWFSLLAFVLGNGIFESLWFFASFDCIAVSFDLNFAPMAGGWTTKHALQFLVGFLSFSIYSGVAHSLFWGAFVLPPHFDGKPRNGKDKIPGPEAFLPGLIFMSFLWFVHYYVYGDMLGFTLCHMVADVGAQISDKIPAPWETSNKSTHEKKSI
uniref:CPBP family intramembrane metalloprotease n=1 Tax=Helicotheca tamesis TaxID=374047 RepID=A0A7S2MM11_9STRA|mmetsp:Transcript_18107/g.24904  ORF Transcript_18107/g.24904 Transcript_18107/m.24904 type:complete len:244 (+) Transcript_18107:85-816(+)